MAVLERTYTIPLRREFLKASKYKRTKKAGIALREFLARHMKSDNVKIGTSVNIELWKHGIRNPPSRIKVNVTKDDKGVVRAELFGAKPSRSKNKTAEKPAEKVPEKKIEKTAEKPAEKVTLTTETPAKTTLKRKIALKTDENKEENTNG